MPARQHSPPPPLGRAHPFLTWMALSFIIWQTLATTTSYPSAPHLNHSSDPDPMAIQTRTLSIKTRRAAKANTSAGIRPRRNTHSSTRSPRGENVNVHLAKLNLPGLRFGRGLTVLGKTISTTRASLKYQHPKRPKSVPPLTPPSVSRRASWCLFSTRTRLPL